MKKIGLVNLNKIRDASDLKEIFPVNILESENFIIKPNWFSPHPGNFTEATPLLLCSTLVRRGKIFRQPASLSPRGTPKLCFSAPERLRTPIPPQISSVSPRLTLKKPSITHTYLFKRNYLMPNLNSVPRNSSHSII